MLNKDRLQNAITTFTEAIKALAVSIASEWDSGEAAPGADPLVINVVTEDTDLTSDEEEIQPEAYPYIKLWILAEDGFDQFMMKETFVVQIDVCTELDRYLNRFIRRRFKLALVGGSERTQARGYISLKDYQVSLTPTAGAEQMIINLESLEGFRDTTDLEPEGVTKYTATFEILF